MNRWLAFVSRLLWYCKNKNVWMVFSKINVLKQIVIISEGVWNSGFYLTTLHVNPIIGPSLRNEFCSKNEMFCFEISFSVLLVDADDITREILQYYNAGVQLPTYVALRSFSSTKGGHALGDIVGNLLSNLTQQWPTFQVIYLISHYKTWLLSTS